MSARATWLAVALVQALAAQAPVVVAGRFFELRCHGGGEAAAMQALAAVEPVWPEVCAFFGVPATPPPSLLTVHLYQDVRAYRSADRRLTGGRYLRNEAMSHWQTRTAHVALQPPCSEAALRARGLPLQTEVMLAWEAAHIARYQLCANFELHPGWFHDGLAGLVARRTLQRRRPQATAQPFFTQRWLRAQRLARAGRLPRARQLLADETQDLSMRDRYAARVSFFEFVAERAPERLRRVADVVRQTGVGSSYGAKVLEAATASLEPLDAAFRSAVEAASPAWEEEVRSLWCAGDEWLQRAFPQADAVALRCEPVRGSRFRASAEVASLDGALGRARFLFGLEGRRGFALALGPSDRFELLQLGPEGDTAAVLARGVAPELGSGAPCPIEVSVDGRALQLRVGARSRRLALPRPLPTEVRWGISAGGAGAERDYGSAVVWRRLWVGGA